MKSMLVMLDWPMGHPGKEAQSEVGNLSQSPQQMCRLEKRDLGTIAYR